MGMMRLLLLALFLCLPSSQVDAARGFDTTYGNGTTDVATTGYTAAAGTQVSISAWFSENSLGGGSVGRLIDDTGTGGSTNWLINAFTNSSTMRFVYYSNGGVTFSRWTFPITNTTNWQHLCLTYDGSSLSNTPVAYVNGISQSMTTVQAPLSSLTHGTATMYVGNLTAGNGVWDGKIAEVGYWNGIILTANECKSLSLGTSPLKVRPASLSLYMPLYGLGSAEPDWSTNHVAQTLTGTKFQPHPPVQAYPLQGINGQ